MACKPFNGLLGFRVYGIAEGSFQSQRPFDGWLVQLLLPDGAPRRADALNKSEGGAKLAVDLRLSPKN
ncbi:MAG: hypothetical protein JWQ69_4076 [Pseudomonas sp.]|nr:hypothetical protein [Pseudomonas sp.]